MPVKILNIFSIFLISMFLSSCGIEYISMSEHDPWDDEDNVKIKKVSTKEKHIKEKKLPESAKEEAEEIVELPDIYEISCELSLEEADLLLKSALEERNFKIIKVSHVTRGMKEQGRTDFWEDMNIYMVCRLSDGYFVLKHNPWLVGMCPLRIYTYRNKENKLVIGFFRPSLAMKWMGNPDLKAIKILKLYDKQLKEAVDTVCSK
ncbi:DUF302 domain-containing protein [Hydrogenothermus marinus]|uniref:Uncharacterized protein (DUF302 family) n=1 Tax=Hydrogenothermus marinus TaxID=133270 RepID=A0A3M0BIJ1_9AQUI|nr:DUF302 domain-containing protein [Hydrogenothermus marinus]RMA96139.1 uncharacterized protein (DUF302 family) [Hydrogenothermus marinus]